MPKAAKTIAHIHTTLTPQRGPASGSAADPVVEMGHAIQRLWCAHRGAEARAWKLKKDDPERRYLEEAGQQIAEWIRAMEMVSSFAVATSLEAGLIHLALANDRIVSIEADHPDLPTELKRIERLLRSAGDAIAATLGDKFNPISAVVTTYSWFGNTEDQPNWLSDVDTWAATGRGAEAA